uniref:MH2 domain-containing protein n=1 Tax=Tetranychus urticae TaxID=32264 RepID=T1K6C1_TETUR
MSRSLLRKRANESSKKEIESWSDELSLFTDNIREVTDKFDTIDSEIWGKIVYMEKNRRLAKAYARSSPNQCDSIVRITNSTIGFDGLTIGLAGFPNPNRDQLTIEALSHLDQGIDVIMEESGNIVVNNQTESRIFIRGFNLSQPDNKRADGLGTIRLLPHQRETLFDINLFLDQIESRVSNQINLHFNSNTSPVGIAINNNTLDSANSESNIYPVRRQLELETISLICFGRETWDLLETPSYLIIINIVALDILKAKIPQKYQRKVKRRRSPLSFLTHLTGSLSGSTPSINLTRSPSPVKDSDSSSSEISVATTEASYPKAAKNINKLVGINQLQENNRSHSWSTLTTSNHNTNLGSIKLPKPDYDQQNKHHHDHHAHHSHHSKRNYTVDKYTSLRRESTANPTEYGYSQTLPSRTGSKSKSYIDLSTEGHSWSQLAPQNQSRSHSSSISSQLEKIKICR